MTPASLLQLYVREELEKQMRLPKNSLIQCDDIQILYRAILHLLETQQKTAGLEVSSIDSMDHLPTFPAKWLESLGWTVPTNRQQNKQRPPLT